MSDTTRGIRLDARRRPAIAHITLGSDRYVDNPEPMPEHRPIGFVRRPSEVDPLLWEGDNG